MIPAWTDCRARTLRHTLYEPSTRLCQHSVFKPQFSQGSCAAHNAFCSPYHDLVCNLQIHTKQHIRHMRDRSGVLCFQMSHNMIGKLRLLRAWPGATRAAVPAIAKPGIRLRLAAAPHHPTCEHAIRFLDEPTSPYISLKRLPLLIGRTRSLRGCHRVSDEDRTNQPADCCRRSVTGSSCSVAAACGFAAVICCCTASDTASASKFLP